MSRNLENGIAVLTATETVFLGDVEGKLRQWILVAVCSRLAGRDRKAVVSVAGLGRTRAAARTNVLERTAGCPVPLRIATTATAAAAQAPEAA